MQKLVTDVVILGGGTAGMGAYRAAKAQTERVILIEDHHFGTTCARVGCMPSKLLIAAAEAAEHARHTAPFGVHVDGDVRINGQEVMQRVKSERDRFVGFVLDSVDEFPAADKILGKARFIDAHTIQVDDHTQIEAQRIVIATGSRTNMGPYREAWANLGDRLIINDDVFEWDDLPKSVAVFGPGVIGLELGQALHRLGVDVTLFGASGRVGPLTDPKLMQEAQKIFKSELKTNLKSKDAVFTRRGDQVEIRFNTDESESQSITVDYVLAATGRRPNVDNLGLEHIDIKLDERGVPVADPKTMQTSVPHIFIAGDASNQLALLHEAADQGRIAGHNAGIYPNTEAGLRRSLLSVVFSDPQIALIGDTHRTLSARFKDTDRLVVGEVSFENQGRSRVMLINKGRLHVYADKHTGLFLGAEMVGPRAEHIAHLLAWSHQQGMSVAEMLDMPFYHPVIEEGVRTALRDALRQIN
ncbi:MAG: dihydrolipoyl dehydrogenase [Neisseriaceae bacterium]|nr:dihydrolipoyl dehydrogenase [Neisseriaceae bacterium]